MAEKPFRVVIAGGSIAGLTLALALEKNGIDFLVLEAYPEIAPQKGASIAVLPNGFRILDQLGCYEDILAKVDRTTDNFIIRDSNGKVLIHVKDLEHHLIQRYVNVLRNLRLDARLKDDLSVQYRCLFGISEKVPGISDDTLHHVTNEGSSLFAASGPNDRTYWCLFINTGSTYHGQDLPPYDAVDEAETARKYGDNAITETVKFSDLYKRKIMTVCTPLHEGVLNTWHSQRCIVVGDAVHKFNPIIGLGGMSAMETCATLTNNLVSLLNAHEQSSTIPSSAIESMFSATQASRQPRATALVNVSQQTQYRFAMETPTLKLFNRYIYPAMGSGAALRLLSGAYPGAASFDTLAIPKKPRTLPYEDELLRQPTPRSKLLNAIVFATMSGLVGIGVYTLFIVGNINGAFPLVRSTVKSGYIPDVGNLALRSVFGAERFPKIDRLLRALTAVFLPVVAGAAGPESKLQAIYFLMSVFVPVLALLVVEGYRKRNTWSLIWRYCLLKRQLFGLGLILPLYALVFFFNSESTSYWMPAERYIPQSTSKAILPALFLGFVAPSALLVSLNGGESYAQETIAFWQITPILVVFLTETLRDDHLLQIRPVIGRLGNLPLVRNERYGDAKGRHLPGAISQGGRLAGRRIYASWTRCRNGSVLEVA
ncbi:hypothetical protein SLS57_006953 [Botryosphaeria dothidea]